jgi:ABC-2 type transport system permease protein
MVGVASRRHRLAGFGLFLLFSYALSWRCACLGILSKGPESAQGLGLVILFPLAFVSSALVPSQHMPAVLRVIADWNPVSAVTAAARQLFENPKPSAAIHAWPMPYPIVATLLWSVALLAIFAPLATVPHRRRTTDLGHRGIGATRRAPGPGPPRDPPRPQRRR